MLHLSRKEDYAVILITALASEYQKRLVPLSEIAQKYEISLLFLRNLASQLRQDGVITATEGKNGGYRLAQDPKSIKMGTILSAFSKESLLQCCDEGVSKPRCPHEKLCPVGNVWRKMNQEFLDKVSGMSVIEFSNYK